VNSITSSFVDMETLFIHKRRQLEHLINKRVHCPETAADLATDIYLKLRRAAPVCQTEAEGCSYLFKMAKTVALDYIILVTRRRNILASVPQVTVPEAEISPEARALASSELRIIESALADMPQKAREMLYMSSVLHMTYDEIAQSMGVSFSLVDKYLRRARVHCAMRLREAEQRAAQREIDLDNGLLPSGIDKNS
jgi:RNA polymerase sigma factor (sigma-70 family)